MEREREKTLTDQIVSRTERLSERFDERVRRYRETQRETERETHKQTGRYRKSEKHEEI